MNPFEFCSSCNEAVQWKCSNCDRENDKSIHTHYENVTTESFRLSIVIQTAVTASLPIRTSVVSKYLLIHC